MNTARAEQTPAQWGRLVPAGAKISWPNLIPMVVGHALALFAFDPDYFTAAGLWAFAVFAFVLAPVGINLCYHRMLTHRGLTVPKWLERVFVVWALCLLEGPPGQWVATHRAHHKHADRENDPHSPRQSFFWSHVGWLMFEAPDPAPTTLYARDILQDRFYRWLQGNYVWAYIFLAHVLLLYAGGVAYRLFQGDALAQASVFGFSLVVWGVFVRTVFVWHVTWSINSFTHVMGYRNYECRDLSRNNPIVAFLTSGEGWHNNHHADPSSACNMHRPWEIDVTWGYIKVLQWLGLAHDIVLPRAKRHALAAEKPGDRDRAAA